MAQDRIRKSSIDTLLSTLKENSNTIYSADSIELGGKEQSSNATNEEENEDQFPLDKKSHPCLFPGCNSNFKFLGNLYRHMQTKHMSLRPFQCDQCHKSFARKEDLVNHMRIHSGEKPFLCKVCGRAFARNSDRRSHERTHLKVKPYKCEICHKSYSRKYDLKRHQLNVHGKAEEKKLSAASSSGKKRQLPTSVKSFPVDHLQIFDDIPDFPALHASHEGCGHTAIRHDDHFDYIINDKRLCVSGISDYFPGTEKTDLIPPPEHLKFLDDLPAQKERDDGHYCDFLQDEKHAFHEGCGHLSIKHDDHFDYVINNKLLCISGVKDIEKRGGGGDDSINGIECKEHHLGCGHLPVRHNDHIDYVVKDSLKCLETGENHNKDLELLEDDFMDVYSALAGMNSDEKK